MYLKLLAILKEYNLGDFGAGRTNNEVLLGSLLEIVNSVLL